MLAKIAAVRRVKPVAIGLALDRALRLQGFHLRRPSTVHARFFCRADNLSRQTAPSVAKSPINLDAAEQ